MNHKEQESYIQKMFSLVSLGIVTVLSAVLIAEFWKQMFRSCGLDV